MRHIHRCLYCGEDWECFSSDCREYLDYLCLECYEAVLCLNCYDTWMRLNSQAGKAYQSGRPIKSRS
jgi:hypothetical protein